MFTTFNTYTFNLDSQNNYHIFVMFLRITSAGRIFGRGYFCYSAIVLEPRHIKPRPKRVNFWLRVLPEAISLYYCLGSDATKA